MAELLILRYDPVRHGLDAITALLHRAYAPHLAAGLEFVAATQGPDVTHRRLTSATCAYVSCIGERIVGTVVYYRRPPIEDVPAWFKRGEVAIFGQFAVEPSLQRQGVGGRMLASVGKLAVADGKTELACDTAAPAMALREYYARRGFREVGTHRWTHGSYESVVLSKSLAEGQR